MVNEVGRGGEGTVGEATAIKATLEAKKGGKGERGGPLMDNEGLEKRGGRRGEGSILDLQHSAEKKCLGLGLASFFREKGITGTLQPFPCRRRC